MQFEDALKEVKDHRDGTGMRLPYWSPDTLVKVQYPDDKSRMSPYLYIENRFGCMPWTVTFADIFSTTWEVHYADGGIRK